MGMVHLHTILIYHEKIKHLWIGKLHDHPFNIQCQGLSLEVTINLINWLDIGS